MADNVAITAGSGTNIATDQLGSGEHVQYVKLMDGTLDSSAKIGGDATNGLDVDVTRVQGTVTVDSELPAAASLADATANPTVPAVGSFAHGWNGSTWDRERSLNDSAQTAQNLAMSSTANAVTVSSLNADATAAVQITGTWTGTLAFEGTVDNTNWFAVGAMAIGGTGAIVTTTTANGQWQADIAGFVGFRVRCSVTGTGTAAVSIRASIGTGLVGIDIPLPAGTNQIGGVNISQINGATPVMGNGVSGPGALRVTVASDSSGQINTLGNLADNAAFTDGTTRLHMAGFIFDETAGTALTENDGAAARVDSKRALVGVLEDATTRGQRAAVNTSGGLAVTPTPHTAGGLTISRTISAASTNATSVKGSAGQIFTIIAHNTNAAVRYLKLYNKATSPTVGTDVPVMTLPIPGNTAGAGFVLDTGGMGIVFGTGIGLALTTGVADADTGGVAANEIVVNLLYK